MRIARVCIFCGSSAGLRPAYAEAARTLALALIGRGIGIVYGGCSIGLMGVLADAALAAGGEVIGVIPTPLATPELAHTGLTELRVVASMHERKATMADLADAVPDPLDHLTAWHPPNLPPRLVLPLADLRVGRLAHYPEAGAKSAI